MTHKEHILFALRAEAMGEDMSIDNVHQRVNILGINNEDKHIILGWVCLSAFYQDPEAATMAVGRIKYPLKDEYRYNR